MATKPIDTYFNVTDSGANNPFTNAIDIGTYGNTAEEYHIFMLAYFNHIPVQNSFTTIQNQINALFLKNRMKYTELFASSQMVTNPLSDMQYTVTEQYGGTDTKTKNNTRQDRGTDTTTSNNTVTDKVTQYNDLTFKNAGQSDNSGGGSVTYGKDTTDSGTDATQYGKTVTRSFSGYKSSQLDLLEKYRKWANWSLFEIIVNDVVEAISTGAYTPKYAHYEEEI